ncbi:unnamed protein product [Allacma fusca]|uniref:Uncharacterized protein n=1 Tax=Allacma fusca TaxID=39272 RepID=A0A8J2PP43_9HEXA|nr:unnamed protein product [Allacma fusca]
MKVSLARRGPSPCICYECHFVAIDTEFSGLHETLAHQFSLFDTPACRYKKMTSCKIRIVQFGVALFKFNGGTNEWHSCCYNFLIFPGAFDTISLAEPIMCQASSLTFLRLHNFDFNMWISEGVPYLNDLAASKVELYLKSRRSIFQNGSEIEKETLSSTAIYKKKLSGPGSATLSDDDIVNLVDDLKGFSRIIQAISASRKIIVGHNAYVDFFLTYQEFCTDLPETYEEFKVNIVKIFPQIVDTKRLAHAIKDHFFSATDNPDTLFDTALLTDTNLFALHFNTQMKEKFSPKIIPSEEYKTVLEQAAKRRIESIPDNLCHDAAFDACVTGCVFIQLAYLIQRPSLQFCSMHATARDQLYGCRRWFNVVNATRCTVPYINLQGDDPVSHRPPLIVVVGHKTHSNLCGLIDKLHRDLPKFGDYDLKYQAGNIVIACGNPGWY